MSFSIWHSPPCETEYLCKFYQIHFDHMAGIYFHIPFCKQACHYCDFHFSTSLRRRDEMLAALLEEIKLRKDYLNGEQVGSIYFGGGTPSLLSAHEISTLITAIQTHFIVDPAAEITLEANPDDLTKDKIDSLRKTQINRFSVGIQSFFDEDLAWMNRAHRAGEAESAVKMVQDAGFGNITSDLIYGFPLLTEAKWSQNIQKTIELGIPHISAYSMTVEPATALAAFIKKGKQAPMDEAQSARQFLHLCATLESEGFEQYEISNFCKDGLYSLHNSNYWKGVPYLGLGPSAHSFNGKERHWNVRNNHRYILSIKEGKPLIEGESLRPSDRLNEYIMTSLRTKWGIDPSSIEKNFGPEMREGLEKGLVPFIAKNEVRVEDGRFVLTQQGKLYADHISASLFIDPS